MWCYSVGRGGRGVVLYFALKSSSSHAFFHLSCTVSVFVTYADMNFCEDILGTFFVADNNS